LGVGEVIQKRQNTDDVCPPKYAFQYMKSFYRKAGKHWGQHSADKPGASFCIRQIGFYSAQKQKGNHEHQLYNKNIVSVFFGPAGKIFKTGDHIYISTI